jgi:hypothetical protein
MEVGATLQKVSARQWMAEIEETCALLGGILAVINPAQYTAGLSCIREIGNRQNEIAKAEHLQELLEVWTSPYNVFSVMNNRNSPLHRDNGGAYSTMDLLTSVGEYRNGRFMVPGVGVEMSNRSGTVIALAGRVVRHGGKCDGERLCIAQYTRQNVYNKLGIAEPGWTSIQNIINGTFV